MKEKNKKSSKKKLPFGELEKNFVSESKQITLNFMKLENSYSDWIDGKMSDKNFVAKADSLFVSLWNAISEALESYNVLVNLFNGDYLKEYEKEIMQDQPDEK